jgi:hypothetical protein
VAAVRGWLPSTPVTVLPLYGCCPLYCHCTATALHRTIPQAVMGARESLEGCFEVLQPDLSAIGATWAGFLWAVQVGVWRDT